MGIENAGSGDKRTPRGDISDGQWWQVEVVGLPVDKNRAHTLASFVLWSTRQPLDARDTVDAHLSDPIGHTTDRSHAQLFELDTEDTEQYFVSTIEPVEAARARVLNSVGNPGTVQLQEITIPRDMPVSQFGSQNVA